MAEVITDDTDGDIESAPLSVTANLENRLRSDVMAEIVRDDRYAVSHCLLRNKFVIS